jgi:hypothetical protein
MVAARGALMDLGKRELTHGVIHHHIVGWFLRFGKDYLPSYILNKNIYDQGARVNKLLRAKGHAFN